MNTDWLPRSPNGMIVCCVEGVCVMPGARWHGTSGGYTNHYCRCEPCTAAASERQYRNGASTRWMRKNIANGLTSNGKPRKLAYSPREKQARDGRRVSRPVLPPATREEEGQWD